MQEARDRALVDEADYLLARQASLKEQARLQPTGYLDSWQRSRVQARLEKMAEPLRNCARRNLERDVLQLGQRCLALAGRMGAAAVLPRCCNGSEIAMPGAQ